MFVITAASGQLGRLIVEKLLKRRVPASQLGVAVRDPEKVKDFAQEGITVYQADYADAEALTQAFQQAEKVVLISGTAFNEERIKQHQNVINAAKNTGVKQVIYTSFLDPDPNSPFSFAASHAATEKALIESGLDWVIVRPTLYIESLIDTVKQATQTGAVVSSAGSGKTSYLSRRDIARTVAALLVSSSHSCKIYTLTGQEAVSGADLAGMLSKLLGKPIRYQPITHETYIEGLKQVGLPEVVAKIYAGLYQAIEMGSFAGTSEDVALITGQAPESVEAFLKRSL